MSPESLLAAAGFTVSCVTGYCQLDDWRYKRRLRYAAEQARSAAHVSVPATHTLGRESWDSQGESWDSQVAEDTPWGIAPAGVMQGHRPLSGKTPAASRGNKRLSLVLGILGVLGILTTIAVKFVMVANDVSGTDIQESVTGSGTLPDDLSFWLGLVMIICFASWLIALLDWLGLKRSPKPHVLAAVWANGIATVMAVFVAA